MSWFGVNLNDGLSQIKGQITSFTRDVLAEETEVKDDDIEIRLPKKQITKYETTIYLYQQEIKELKEAKEESEEMLRASDYHNLQKITTLQKQLAETQEELERVKNKSGDWVVTKWENDSENDQRSQIQARFYEDKVASLQRELEQERQRHQEEVVALQDVHREELRRITGEFGSENDGVAARSSATLQALAATEKDQGKEAGTEHLYEEVKALKAELELSIREKDQLSNSLVDLDNQHQVIIDEFIKSRNQLTQDLEEAKKEIKSLRMQILDQEEKNDKIDFLTKENLELQQILERTKASNEDKDSIYKRVAELEQICKDQLGQIDVLTKQSERAKKSESEVIRISDLAKQAKEEHQNAVGQLELNITNFKKREEALQYENETLQKRFTSKENDYDQQGQTIKEQRDKILSLEEEILKFEAVLEGKNIEHHNTFSQLKLHEELTRITLGELKEDKKKLEDRVRELQQSCGQGNHDSNSLHQHNQDIIEQMMAKCSIQNPNELPSAVSDLNCEVASLRCERDRYSEDLASTMQDLREAQELVETLEEEKADLERESEDLRDQLEELQCGERAPPEGSITPRALPTIEEEEVDTNATPNSEIAERCSTERGESKKDETGEGETMQLLERINYLSSRVSALTKANTSLEAELAAVKNENGILGEQDKKLHAVSEAQASIPHSETGPASHEASEIQKQSSPEEEKAKLERQIVQMANAMDKMHFDSAHLSSREEEYQKEITLLQDQIVVQNETIHEYFHEIARLKTALNEKSNATAILNESQAKFSAMEAELDKVKGLVIYKDDQIDQLTQELEQIGQIFKLNGVDRQFMYFHVKQEYFKMITKINTTKEELETLRVENARLQEAANESEEKTNLETFCQVQNELEVTKAQLIERENDLLKCKAFCDDQIKENTKELESVLDQNKKLTAENEEHLDRLKTTLAEKEMIELEIKKQKQSSYLAISAIEGKENELLRLQETFVVTEKELEAKITSLQQDLASKVKEIESLNELTKQNSDVEKLKCELLKSTQKQCNDSMVEVSKLKEENESLQSKIAQFDSERQQMILTSTQKHQEAVTYYQEIQRLNGLLQQNQTQKVSDYEALQCQFKDAEDDRLKATREVESLRMSLNSLQNDSVSKLEALKLKEESERKAQALKSLTEEYSRLQEAHKSITKERDRLRVANSSFNSQYEDKGREVVALQDRERHLTQEVERLKEHLVQIEETYTNEAVKSEERAAALRLSLAKMHEKIASNSTHYSTANQKTSAQLEIVQKQLQEAIHERDEAKTQLECSEEASLQHQEATIRLQQVLQDFQKNHMKDVAMATTRERKNYEEERRKNGELNDEIKRMKERLEENETRSAATSALARELQSKEDSIIALKTQVHAIQLAAKRSQDQVALLQSSADGKVDKHLLRNLIVGYFATPSDKQREVLRVVAQVLDFSPEERARAGIDQHPGSWLNSIANFLAPPPSNIRVASKVDVLDHSSLSQAFIRFLEEESSPRTQPRLPAVQMAEEAHQKAQKKAHSKVTPVLRTPCDAPSTLILAVSNSSSGATEIPNPLLHYSTASLPQNFPVISSPVISTSVTMFTPSTEAMVSTPRFLNSLLNPTETSKPQYGSDDAK